MPARARYHNELLQRSCRRMRREGGSVQYVEVVGTLTRGDDGAETLELRSPGRRPPRRMTIRRWLVAAWGDFRPWPPGSWEYEGSAVRIVNEEPEPPTGGEA